MYRDFLVKEYLPLGTGQPSSITRRVRQDLVRLTIAAPNFSFDEPHPRIVAPRGIPLEDSLKLHASQRESMEWQPKPWLLPSHSELASLTRSFGCPPFQPNRHPIKYYFSATTAALVFLRSIDKNAQSHLRTIVIHENCPSVAFPATHPQGLIPYCRDNPNLHVDHRVSVWRALLLDYNNILAHNLPRRSNHGRRPPRSTVLSAATLAISWIGEARLLEKSGMPKSSYNLIFEGSARVKQQIWDYLKGAAAAQDASWELVRRGEISLTNPLTLNLGRPRLHTADELPQAIREMIKGTSCIRIDAYKGHVWDVDEVIATEPEIQTQNWGSFYNAGDLDQSELEKGQEGLLEGFRYYG
jgi:hypothetical protein